MLCAKLEVFSSVMRDYMNNSFFPFIFDICSFVTVMQLEREPWEFSFPHRTLRLPCKLAFAEMINCCSTLLAKIPFQYTCNLGKT